MVFTMTSFPSTSSTNPLSRCSFVGKRKAPACFGASEVSAATAPVRETVTKSSPNKRTHSDTEDHLQQTIDRRRFAVVNKRNDIITNWQIASNSVGKVNQSLRFL